MEILSIHNCGVGYKRMMTISCGQDLFNHHCLNVVVSVVTEDKLESLRKRGVAEVSNKVLVDFTLRNKTDPKYAGTVLFQGSPFMQKDIITPELINLNLATHDSAVLTREFPRHGYFGLLFLRQTNTSNRSMGEGSAATNHHYYNEMNTKASLSPLSMSSVNV